MPSLPVRPLLAEAYDNVKRPSKDYSLSEAIRHHSQACGLVAFVFNIHPDTVAEAVAFEAGVGEAERRGMS